MKTLMASLIPSGPLHQSNVSERRSLSGETSVRAGAWIAHYACRVIRICGRRTPFRYAQPGRTDVYNAHSLYNGEQAMDD